MWPARSGTKGESRLLDGDNIVDNDTVAVLLLEGGCVEDIPIKSTGGGELDAASEECREGRRRVEEIMLERPSPRYQVQDTFNIL
jgi:hypothetical protein